jgi:hypothetical protein
MQKLTKSKFSTIVKGSSDCSIVAPNCAYTVMLRNPSGQAGHFLEKEPYVPEFFVFTLHDRTYRSGHTRLISPVMPEW